MGSNVPPRVTFWTGTWDPSREAMSKEVAALRRLAASPAPLVSFSPVQSTGLLPREGAIRLSGRRWLTLRAVAALVERWGDVTHVMGGLRSWHLLQAVGRRPVLLTVALPGGSSDPRIYQKVSLFAVESAALADELRGAGVPADRIEVIYPGVDLDEYRPGDLPPPEPFRVLFASSPADPGEFEARGIPLLIETARECPTMEFLFLWREWGNGALLEKAWHALEPPPNVRLVRRDTARMSDAYNSAHAVACCYAPGFGKSAPNSVIEALACGRPALVLTTCGIAGLLRDNGAGVVSRPHAPSLALALEQLQAQLSSYCEAARGLAERVFDADVFRRRYLLAYEKLMSGTSA